MSELFMQLRVYAPSGLVFEERVRSVVLPGADGEIGILPQHARYVGNLSTGIMKFETEKPEEYGFAAIFGGVCHILEDEVTVLADGVVLPDEAASQSFVDEKKQLENQIGSGDSYTIEWGAAKERYSRIEAIERLKSLS